MKIGFYFNSDHLGTWTWKAFKEGTLPLSGTDILNLYIPMALAEMGLEITFYSNMLGGENDKLDQCKVKNVTEAIYLSKVAHIDVLWFSNTASVETIDGIRASELLDQACVVSDGNGPSPEFADLFSNARSIRRVVCVSGWQADNLRDHALFKKTEYVYNPLIPRRVRQLAQRDPGSVCFLGALTKSKGFHHLARVWRHIREEMPGATLKVLGSGRLYQRDLELGPLGIASKDFELTEVVPYLGSTREQAERLGVQFLGLAPPNLVQETLEQSAICVVNPNCKTNYETFCISAIEASAAGAAVIGANRGGLQETIIHNKTGLRVNSTAQLASAIIKLISKPNLARQYGEAGRRWAHSEFAAEMSLKRWIQIFECVAEDKNALPPTFSWKRADFRILMRELIRRANQLPIVDGRLPSLHKIRARLTA